LHAANAEYGVAVAKLNYQSVVLEALRHVADVLRALDNDAQTLAALATADSAAQSSLESIQRQYALRPSAHPAADDVARQSR
jgi:outer membrane protein TolC